MRERTLPRYRVSHMHSCGHVDDCFLERTAAEGKPCGECSAAAFNRKQAERRESPPQLRVGDAFGLAW